MRWDCEKRGCFNVKKRPKIEVFADCFPGNIQMSDVDGEVEINSHWLRLEWKEPGASLPVGQRINYERITFATKTVVFVVQGDAETMRVDQVSFYMDGKLKFTRAMNLDELKDFFVRWADWAEQPDEW